MTLIFPKSLILVLFVGVSACSSSLPFGGTGDNATSDDVGGRIVVSPPEAEVVVPKVVGNDRLMGFVHFEVIEAAAAATDEVGSQLGLGAGVVAKGPSAGFREKAAIPQETIDAVEFLLPFVGGLTDNLVVMYRLLPVGDAAPGVGLIPLSYLKVDSAAGTVTFKPRGLGDYQVAHTPEKVVKPLASNDGMVDTAVPTGEMPTLQPLGSVAFQGGFAFDLSTTHAFVVGDGGARTVEISNAAAMRIAGSSGVSGAGRGAQLVGNVLVQVTGAGALNTINVANPNNPVFRAGVNDSASSDVVMIGNVGFATNTQGIRTFLLNNEAIALNSQVNQAGGCVSGSGDNRIAAFVCAATVIGFTTNALPQASLGFPIDNAVGGRGVAVSGNYVYVVGDDGLRIYDTTRPTETRRVGALSFAGGRAIAISGDVALVVTATEARLVDITNKAVPGFYSANASMSLNGGRRVRMIPGTKRAIILDEAGLKQVEIR